MAIKVSAVGTYLKIEITPANIKYFLANAVSIKFKSDRVIISGDRDSDAQSILFTEFEDDIGGTYTTEATIADYIGGLISTASGGGIVIDALTYPVENSYVNSAAMFADQVNQTTNYFQYVIDIDTYYEYLGTTVGDITDYRELTADEVTIIQVRGNTPVDGNYTDAATMYADQNKQKTGYIYRVNTDDSYYEYLGTRNGDATDYKQIGGGAGSLTQDTGTTITFTEDTVYNGSSYLLAGNLTLDMTGAVTGTVAIVYCNGYVPTITGDYILSSGNIDANFLNVLSFFYDGVTVYLNVGNAENLSAPTVSLTPADTQIQVDWTSVTNADNYVVERADDSGFTTNLTQIYSGALLTYTDTGLTNGQTYYYRAKAQGTGYVESGWSATQSDAPFAYLILYQDDHDTFDTGLWALNNGSGAWDGAVTNAYQWTEPAPATGNQAFIGGNANQEVQSTGTEVWTYKFDLNHHGNYTCGEFKFQMYGESPVRNELFCFIVGHPSSVTATMWINTGSFVDTGISASGSWKMVLDNNALTCTYYWWNGSSWISQGSRALSENTNRYYPLVRLDEGSTYDLGEITRYSGHVITQGDYSTLNP